MRFPPEVIKRLKSYVYAYVDPRGGEVFYVGKGLGNRAFQHLNVDTKSAKAKRIRQIRKEGLSPQIDILVYGLTAAEAHRVEAVCIDLVGLSKLTNLISGQRPSW